MNTDQIRRKPASKLAPNDVMDAMTRLANNGSSLAEIQRVLAEPAPAGFDVRVSRTAIFQKLKAAGIQLRGKQISSTNAPMPSPEALAHARRDIDPVEMARLKEMRVGRPQPWLAAFKKEIDELVAEGYPYRSIFDILALRYPIVPQLAAQISDKRKTDSIALFLRRQRLKSAAKTKRRNPLVSELAPTRSIPLSPDAVEVNVKPRAGLPTKGTDVAALIAERERQAVVQRAQDPDALARAHERLKIGGRKS